MGRSINYLIITKNYASVKPLSSSLTSLFKSSHWIFESTAKGKSGTAYLWKNNLYINKLDTYIIYTIHKITRYSNNKLREIFLI